MLNPQIKAQQNKKEYIPISQIVVIQKDKERILSKIQNLKNKRIQNKKLVKEIK